MTKNKNYFELHRLIDNLVYRFDRTVRPDGQIGYKRRDVDIWIIRKPIFGWVVFDEDNQLVQGRPWTVTPDDQDDNPPEDIWVSLKNNKSYVYDLRYYEPSDSDN